MNSESLYKAEIIWSNRPNELNKEQIYKVFELERIESKEVDEKSFIRFLGETARSRSGGNVETWKYAIIHFKMFLRHRDILMAEIDVTRNA